MTYLFFCMHCDFFTGFSQSLQMVCGFPSGMWSEMKPACMEQLLNEKTVGWNARNLKQPSCKVKSKLPESLRMEDCLPRCCVWAGVFRA